MRFSFYQRQNHVKTRKSILNNMGYHQFVKRFRSALQTLHKASTKARECNYFKGGGTHHWIDYYEKRITSDRSCLNEWHAMDDLESRRPPSPDTVRSRPTEREETEKHIRTKLKEVMMSVDLDEVTSKYIRTKLEEILDMNLKEYKPFIDQEMLTILGQMDAPTEIFQYLYLGSEWNASNLEELVVNGIGHILNVTREIDNFFPGVFDYQNIRVYDDESTEILHYWDKTYRYIRKAKDEGSKVLVHCKMGISRSASVVIAYVMKAYDWNLQEAFDFVKNKRNCIKPNSGFLKQLEIYQGILDASKHRHNSLWRSKSETNLKSNDKPKKNKPKGKENVPTKSESLKHLQVPGRPCRPKSWSPSDSIADALFPPNGSMSSETLSSSIRSSYDLKNISLNNENKVPGDLQFDVGCIDRLVPTSTIPRVSSIKDRINELESQVSSDIKGTKSEVKSPGSQSRSGLVLNLATQFESGSKPSSPIDDGLLLKSDEIVEPVLSQTKPPVHKHHAVLVKPAMWSEENFHKPCLISNSLPLESKDLKLPINKPFKSTISTFSSKMPRSVSKNGELSAVKISNPDKTSHKDSAFKLVPVKIDECVRENEIKNPTQLVTKLQVSGLSPPAVSKTNQKGELKTSPILQRCFKSEKSDQNSQNSTNSRLIYDKEAIPFIPGTVKRTKQKIEEKSLTRTTSFDSGIPVHFGLIPSPPTDPEPMWEKPVRRSQSLRCHHRPTSMFSGKWYPLPALASLSPKPVKTTEDIISQRTMTHSISTPSVVEAVNQVICGTQEVLSSAIRCLPSEKTYHSSGNASTDSELEFGSSNSLPDINAETVFPERSQCYIGSESPTPGIVRQQREILENKTPKSEKTDICKKKNENALVPFDSCTKTCSAKDLGLVKRLTKELEAKTTDSSHRKDKISPTDDKLKNSLPNSQTSPDLGIGPRQTSGLRSSLPSNIGKKLSSFNQPGPPTPHRKTSLDLNFLKKTSRFPLSLKYRNQTKSESTKSNEAEKNDVHFGTLQRTNFQEQFDSSKDCFKVPAGRPPHAVKFVGSDVPPPPPLPIGPPRKLIRKQHGSTHPLSRLTIRQRHTNPLYNTM